METHISGETAVVNTTMTVEGVTFGIKGKYKLVH
jgi:hypothetical protein